MATKDDDEKKKDERGPDLPRPLDNGQHTTEPKTTLRKAGEATGTTLNTAGEFVGDTIKKVGSRIAEIPGIAAEGALKSTNVLFEETPLKAVNPYDTTMALFDFSRGVQKGLGQDPKRPPNPALAGTLRGNVGPAQQYLADARPPQSGVQAAPAPVTPTNAPLAQPPAAVQPPAVVQAEPQSKATNTGTLTQPPASTSGKVARSEAQKTSTPSRSALPGFDLSKYTGPDSVEVIRGTTRYLAAPDGSEIRADLLGNPVIAQIVAEMDKAVSDERTPAGKNSVRQTYLGLINRVLGDQQGQLDRESAERRAQIVANGTVRAAQQRGSGSGSGSGSKEPFEFHTVKVPTADGGEMEVSVSYNNQNGQIRYQAAPGIMLQATNQKDALSQLYQLLNMGNTGSQLQEPSEEMINMIRQLYPN